MIVIVVVAKTTGKALEIEAKTDFVPVIFALPRLITKVVFMKEKYLIKTSRYRFEAEFY